MLDFLKMARGVFDCPFAFVRLATVFHAGKCCDLKISSERSERGAKHFTFKDQITFS